MNDELDKQLCEKYPKIFKQRNMNMQDTAMCWGFEHGDGWYNIIDALCGNIQWHIDQRIDQHDRAVKHNQMRDEMLAGDNTKFDARYADYKISDPDWVERRRADILEKPWKVPEIVPQVEAAQVKEKFGTLRFYVDGGDDVIHGMISMAESMSARTCEVCGSPGTHRGGGWVRTLCDTHATKNNNG